MKSPTSLLELGNLKAGDVIGFCGSNYHSDLINILTYGWPRYHISHVGVVADYEGNLLIFESTTSAPDKCVIQNAYVTGSQAQRPSLRVPHYKGKVWHYPLVKPLTLAKSYRLTNYVMKNIGKPYDAAGAMHAGARLWADCQAFLHEESLAALFCSEWVASAHRHIGLFETANASKWSPNRLIKEELRRGILSKPVRLK
jgi:Orthopoxvirus protein of unknown function (DUF830).